ncbi:hypothetical protein [Chitinophaga pinensis]|uniref:Uncharacterized protein n=1 Tax=Chitinophaga pinensis (strain ATCC 43595 / DSM 2588 / LMG 13176 / NBRC 15968 / NCIMB 11800 / UQM 2034) TaxID=485918 RepID=A0A979H151_CHIPD|nr:hypothetical protein [Chitinophaga pinensis]ACU64055.1 hypothetical protein Cpin_6651 [Chitinophaga pinensis DSM 2588]
MSFFKRFFNKKKTLIQCPRCLGKGHVDADDIKRLGRELTWRPGSCAYCNAKGEVAADIIDKINPGEAYLVNNLSEKERLALIEGHPEARERMKRFKINVDRFIQDIVTLHFVRKLDSRQIAELFLESAEGLSAEDYAQEEKDLIAYIEKVIARHN